MTQFRRSQVSLSDTPLLSLYFTLCSSCLFMRRRKYTEKSFEHRRQWVVERIHYLASLFNIDICAYAIMSNHYNLVLHVDEMLNENLSHEDVCERWCQLYSKPVLIERWQNALTVSEAENKAALEVINGWRGRLADISWFMRCLNEFVARKVNKEDACSGRFWEGRFKSQALLDEDALLACMAYVNLNPVRAKMNDSIETSEYTSAYERLLPCKKVGVAQQQEELSNYHVKKKPLFGFVGDEHEDNPQGMPFSLLDYIELVDWSGRIIREDKRGAISSKHPRLLTKLDLDSDTWISLASRFGKEYQGAVGSLEALALFASHTSKRWIASKNQL